MEKYKMKFQTFIFTSFAKTSYTHIRANINIFAYKRNQQNKTKTHI